MIVMQEFATEESQRYKVRVSYTHTHACMHALTHMHTNTHTHASENFTLPCKLLYHIMYSNYGCYKRMADSNGTLLVLSCRFTMNNCYINNSNYCLVSFHYTLLPVPLFFLLVAKVSQQQVLQHKQFCCE